MTGRERASRNERTIRNIRIVFQGHQTLSPHLETVEVSLDEAGVVLRGHLPNAGLKQELVPAVRQQQPMAVSTLSSTTQAPSASRRLHKPRCAASI